MARDHLFKKGNPGGPGRGSSGRTKALKVLDDMLAVEGNQRKLKKALQEEFDKSPTAFFRTYTMPLLPKDQNVKVDFSDDITIVFADEDQVPEEE